MQVWLKKPSNALARLYFNNFCKPNNYDQINFKCVLEFQALKPL